MRRVRPELPSPGHPRATAAARWAVLASTCALAQGQTVLHVEPGDPAEAHGAAVAFWDDLNGDGRVEWAVGEPLGDLPSLANAGYVRIHDGGTNALAVSFSVGSANAHVGRACARVGDLDGDGRAELAYGAPGARRVSVKQSTLPIGTDLWFFQHPTLQRFGEALAPAGDVNGDGVPDIVVGAPGAAAASAGAVVVLSGVDGSIVFERSVPGLFRLGHSVAAAGDVNGDGFADVVAGAPLTFNDDVAQGAAAVLLGPTGTTWHVHRPSGFQNRGQEFGSSVAPAGDLDGDGFDDYAVGARWYGGFHFIDESFVAVYSGANQSELWRVEGPADQWFGHSLVSAGDVDADGHPDLAVGDPLSAKVSVFSPRRNALIYEHSGPPNSYFGASLGEGVDANGDGFPELIVGSLHVSSVTHVPFGSGDATLLTLGCPPDAAYAYCTTSPNSASATGARIGSLGSTSVSGTGLRLYATDCPTNTFALFFHGTEEAFTPSGFGNVCVGGQLGRLDPASPTGTGGVPTFDLDPAALGWSAGETRFFQCWMRDNQGGQPGFNYTDGLRVTFCP